MTTPILISSDNTMSVTHIVMGLANFTTYTFTVATYNQDGLGPQTQTSTIQTPEAGEFIAQTIHSSQPQGLIQFSFALALILTFNTTLSPNCFAIQCLVLPEMWK